mmetsp:Transcript_56039/g.63947  ORF Transcript_56039/g.63947 Transcript_56039/m.63947 type:complete len:251 (+) Transcript_56039:123-875(+)
MSAGKREPCPTRVLDDLGGGFGMGCAGGSIWYMLKGMYNAPRRQRIIGGINLLKHRAPLLGGAFALWGGTFGAVECSMIAIRKREDPLNNVIAGFLTGGIMRINAGWTAMRRGAIFGGLMLTFIEGVTRKMMMTQMAMQMEQMKHFEDYLDIMDTEMEKFGKTNLPHPQRYMMSLQHGGPMVDLDDYKKNHSVFVAQGLQVPREELVLEEEHVDLPDPTELMQKRFMEEGTMAMLNPALMQTKREPAASS